VASLCKRLRPPRHCARCSIIMSDAQPSRGDFVRTHQSEQKNAAQLIDGDGILHQERLSDLLDSSDERLVAPIVSIIGPQSSGKSTLLNALFSTSFTTLEPWAPPQRTTRGVWVALSPSSALVLDVQGSDSIEGGEMAKTLERRSALFGIAISSVAIVNIHFKDLARHEGSQLSLLRQIFAVQAELALGQPARGSRALLLFVIRDYPSGRSDQGKNADASLLQPIVARPPLQPIADRLCSHIADAWRDATSGFSGRVGEVSDHFRLHVCTLPNPQVEPGDFHAAVAQLKHKHFGPDSPAFVDGVHGVCTRPSEIVAYMCELWTQIRSARQLDAPSFRESLALRWCDDIRLQVEATHHAHATRLWEYLGSKLAAAAAAPEDGSRDAAVPAAIPAAVLAATQDPPDAGADSTTHTCDCEGADVGALCHALAAGMRAALRQYDEQTRGYHRGVVAQQRVLLTCTLERVVEPMLRRLLLSDLQRRSCLRVRPALERVSAPTVVGTLDVPGPALAALPLRLTVGEIDEIVARECSHSLMLLDAFGALAPEPGGRYGAAIEESEAPDPTGEQGWTVVDLHACRTAEYGSRSSDRATDLAPLGGGDYSDDCCKNDPGGGVAPSKLLSEAMVTRLAGELRESCSERVRRAWLAQEERHSETVAAAKENAAGLAIVGGGLLWAAGSWFAGPVAVLAGGAAGGTSTAAAIVRRSAAWVVASGSGQVGS